LGDPIREELSVQNKRAILVSVVLPDDPILEDDPLNELKGLVKTAGVQVAGELIQRRQELDPTLCIGRGKLDELRDLLELHNAEIVIFDNNLSPAQGRNLENELKKVIVDRSEIILDIFATHARTHESRLQVELAQLLYSRPRLKRMWSHLSRESGSGQNKGTGEKQLETDKRLVDHRVADLKKKLEVVEHHRERMVAQRRNQTQVSLVGYTNAGKSTLMNALTGAGVYAADQLFATLDTRTRAWRLPQWGDALLSDTVGFIRNLPHHLVASFRSTLEEARHANVLLHVVDASHPCAEEQIRTVNDVLEQIDVNVEHSLLVLNKVDAVKDRSLLDVLRAKHPDAISVSARTGLGLDRLTRYVADKLSGGYVDAEVDAGIGNGRIYSYLNAHAQVHDTAYGESRVIYRCRIPQRFYGGLKDDDTHVTVVGKIPATLGNPVDEAVQTEIEE
jgi:GTP-binding protein HflX